ncbi:hypothetical protein AMELA_G00256480 [Ameiurus melas]|uniref:Uncharacterized protein n=1 Tax=Ameiurus melas TaxID=219545 RepID=A0A7J5ZVG6_AMEME|nr:hypothetical protein AMELA_G00256480 [Ameiurus melas]
MDARRNLRGRGHKAWHGVGGQLVTDCLFFFGKEAQHNQEEVTFSSAKAFGESLISLCADGSGLEIEAAWH